MRNECDQLAIFPFLCVLYSFTSLVMVAILIPCLPANSDKFISIADTRTWNQRHNCWTGEGCYGRWKILFFRIRLSSKIETGYSVNCAKSVHDGYDLLTFEIKARNKRSKGIVVFVGPVVRSDILSFLSTINICPVINVILTPQPQHRVTVWKVLDTGHGLSNGPIIPAGVSVWLALCQYSRVQPFLHRYSTA